MKRQMRLRGRCERLGHSPFAAFLGLGILWLAICAFGSTADAQAINLTSTGGCSDYSGASYTAFSSCSSGSLTVAVSANQTLVVVNNYGGWQAGTTLSAADSLGNTWYPIGAQSTNSVIGAAQIFYSTITHAGSTTISCNASVRTSYPTCLWMLFSGVATASPVDASAGGPFSANGKSSQCSTPNVSTSNASDVLVETCLTAGGGLTFTAGSGFTQAVTDPTNQGSSTEYDVVGTVQSGLTVTQSFSSSHTWLSLVTALKAVSTGTLAFTTTSVPKGQINQPYPESSGSGVQLQCTGGTAPYTFAINSGGLPSGLSLSSSGLISGTSPASGTSTFTAKCTDAAKNAATSGSLTITIASLSSIAVTPASPSIPVGGQQQFTATATYSDNSTANVTSGSTGPIALQSSGGCSDYSGASYTAFSSCSSGSLTVAVSANQTLVVVNNYGGWQAGTTLSAADSLGNTWYPIGAQSTNSVIGAAQIFYSTITHAGSTTISCNASVRTSYPTCLWMLFSGVATASPVDASAGGPFSANGKSSQCSTPNVSTSNASDVLVETCLTAGGGLTFTAGSGFTQAVTDPTNQGSSTEYDVVGTVQSGLTVTQSFSSSHTWLSLVTALKAVNGTTWSASNGDASVNASGLAQGISVGTTTIQACIGGICGSTTLTVTSGTGGGGTPPTAVISANPTSGTAALTVAFSGSGSTDPDGTITSYAWNFGDGQTSSTESPSHSYAVVGPYTVKLTVTDNSGRQGSTTTAITVSAPASYAGVYRIIAGGGPYTDSQQQVWQADAGFNTGNVTTTGAAISGTTDPALYQSERWDIPSQAQLEYELPVPNGTYLVNLYFAETDAASEGVGQRVFGVDFQGLPAITNLDIYGTVGANAALVKSAVVTVNNGTLTVDFVRGVGNPKIDAIEVREVSSHDLALPKSSWKITGEEDGFWDVEDDTLNGSALNAIDNDASTFWMTRITTNNQGAPPNYPHDLQIDLGKSYPLSGFQYLPRQDGSTQGMIGQYSFSVSADGVNWGSPVASGTFSAGALQKQVSFAPVNARYVQLEALTDVNGNTTGPASMAELGILFECTTTPSVVITAPVDEYLQSSGASLTAAAHACLDPVQNAGWGVQFTRDGGNPINVYTPPFQATFTNLSKAEHVIDAYVINSSGTVVSATGPTHDEVKEIGIGDYYVTMGDSVNWGEYGTTVTSTDGRDTGSGYGPLLNNMLTSFKGYPQQVANEAVPGTTAAEGLEALPSILKKDPNSQTFLVNFGMNDSDYWLPIPSGEGLNPGDSGYAGSYKDTMQQIINQVNTAGKHVALGKTIVALADCPDSVPSDPGYCPPYTTLNTGAKNVLIQQYNEVMDELMANSANGITVTPPDFYTFFSNPYPYPTEYHNWWHPNQTGYQDMAQLWFQALTQ